MPLASFLFFLAFVPYAAARPEFVGTIPNGNVNSCSTCHTGDAYARNPFGLDVEATMGDAPVWADLVDLDSDGDAQTNGQELGDPCTTWESGAAPRTTDVSKPGDATSTSADPDSPDCGDDTDITGETGDTSDTDSDTDTDTDSDTDTDTDSDTDTDTDTDAGIGDTDGADDTHGAEEAGAGGCGCSTGGVPAGWSALGLLGALLPLIRRRRS